MRYCDRCGNGHECTAEEAERMKYEVKMEELRTNRDIEVARVNASAAKTIAETEAESGAARAEGEADGMREVIEAATGGETGTEPVPIMVDGPPAEPELEPGPDVEPPPAPEVSAEPDTRGGGGWWDGYR